LLFNSNFLGKQFVYIRIFFIKGLHYGETKKQYFYKVHDWRVAEKVLLGLKISISSFAV